MKRKRLMMELTTICYLQSDVQKILVALVENDSKNINIVTAEAQPQQKHIHKMVLDIIGTFKSLCKTPHVPPEITYSNDVIIVR